MKLNPTLRHYIWNFLMFAMLLLALPLFYCVVVLPTHVLTSYIALVASAVGVLAAFTAFYERYRVYKLNEARRARKRRSALK